MASASWKASSTLRNYFFCVHIASHLQIVARRKLRQEQAKAKVNLMKLLLNNVVEIITWKIPILFSKKQQDGNIMLLSSGVFQL